MNRFTLGVFFVILSAVGFGVMPIIAKYAYQGGVNVDTLLTLRFSLASIFFFLYLWLKKGHHVSITKKEWLALALYGGVIYAVISILFFWSIQFIPVSLASLLLYTYPVFVVVLSIIVERTGISKMLVLAILLSLLGLALVLGTSFHLINYYGVMLAVLSSIGYAVHIVLMNRTVRKLPPLITTAFVILFTAISQLLFGIACGTLHTDFSGSAWLSILALCFVSTILPLLTFFLGLQLVGPTNASILSTFEPIVTILLSALLFHETFTLLQLLGIAAVLIGAFLVVKGGSQKPADGPAAIVEKS
ncbi:DMT family transporter [Brevibacillus fluminis]|uniref:DMT family transporter n=1 Tax=Brevibacillus fluminis TaxID=511487 RepID=UPI003F897729